MTKTTKLAFGPGIVVQGVVFRGNRWVVSAEGKGSRLCPGCGDASGSRHSLQMRRLQELPIQGVPATLELRSGLWKCRNEECSRKTFPETLAIALPSARTTRRVGELVRLFGHAAAGRVSERLLTRLGVPVSDNAILRQLKSHVGKQPETEPLRARARSPASRTTSRRASPTCGYTRFLASSLSWIHICSTITMSAARS